MNPVRNLLLLLAIFLLNLASPAAIAASADASTDTATILVELNDGLLTAEFHDAPLPQVLAEVGKVAGFKFVRVADFNDFPRISGSFQNRPLQQAVKRLAANTNSIFFYSPDDGAQSQRVISQLWLLGPGEAGDISAQPVEAADGLQHAEAEIRSQAALRLVQQQGEEAVVEKLSVLLHTDRDPLVRSRVAIALGSLKDERAVPELESALRDTSFSVRAQSMSALGRIGGERATRALGNILLDSGLDPVERVIAAQALWKQDSEIATGYLQAGSDDSNAQVRDAARRAPVVSVKSSTGAQAGPEATE